MLDYIQFRNFKVLRDAVLPLGRFTLIIGPNSSGKSTALEAIARLGRVENVSPGAFRSIGADPAAPVELTAKFDERFAGAAFVLGWQPNGAVAARTEPSGGADGNGHKIIEAARGFRVFSFDADRISQAASLQEALEMRPDGQGLASVLDRLRDLEPERFDALSADISRWFPEFERITFAVQNSQKSFGLRLKAKLESIPAAALSEGTRIGMALLTLAHFPQPPTLIGIEEPERGVHPRLLREVFDALHRLSHPEHFGDPRRPVQVVATSHSPYFLDLFKDLPEEVVVAHRNDDGSAGFTPLSNVPHLAEILDSAPLGEAWFTGVLGGVPLSR